MSSISALQTTRSFSPTEYQFAISKNVIPASTARFSNGRASRSSRTQGLHRLDPMVIVPRQYLLTVNPVPPNFVYSIISAPPRSSVAQEHQFPPPVRNV